MKKNTNISGYFFLGILWIFLFSSVSSTFCYGDLSSINSTSYQESISLQGNQGHQFIASEIEHPFEKLPFEIEEESTESTTTPLVQQISFLHQSISPTYQDFLLTTPQQKRYLLFHHLKIDC